MHGALTSPCCKHSFSGRVFFDHVADTHIPVSRLRVMPVWVDRHTCECTHLHVCTQEYVCMHNVLHFPSCKPRQTSGHLLTCNLAARVCLCICVSVWACHTPRVLTHARVLFFSLLLWLSLSLSLSLSLPFFLLLTRTHTHALCCSTSHTKGGGRASVSLCLSLSRSLSFSTHSHAHARTFSPIHKRWRSCWSGSGVGEGTERDHRVYLCAQTRARLACLQQRPNQREWQARQVFIYICVYLYMYLFISIHICTHTLAPFLHTEEGGPTNQSHPIAWID